MNRISTGLRGDTEDIISKTACGDDFGGDAPDEEPEMPEISMNADGADAGAGVSGADRPARRFFRGSGSILAVFAAGVMLGAALLATLANVLGAGHYLTNKQWEYYSDLDGKLGKYYTIIKMIGEDPIAVSTPDEITDDTLKELVSSAGDPYAEYFTAEEYARYDRRYSADYVGIGIGVKMTDEGIVVGSVIPDGPADEAGIEAGDIIALVDGREPADLDEAVELITGEAGTEVDLTVLRDGRQLELTVTRTRLDQDSVFYNVIEDYKDAGYIRITSFRRKTDDEFKLAVRDLKNKGCTRFIIDLRDNGGGLTDMSVSIADYLLPECKIMTEIRKDGTEKVFNSGQSSAEIEYVLLVNENTASASEILAGAVQDNHGGAVIGKRTYGKGVTQTSHKFSDGSAVKMTVSEYFRPGGGKVNGIGITPDIEAGEDDMIDKAAAELGLESAGGSK